MKSVSHDNKSPAHPSLNTYILRWGLPSFNLFGCWSNPWKSPARPLFQPATRPEQASEPVDLEVGGATSQQGTPRSQDTPRSQGTRRSQDTPRNQGIMGFWYWLCESNLSPKTHMLPNILCARSPQRVDFLQWKFNPTFTVSKNLNRQQQCDHNKKLAAVIACLQQWQTIYTSSPAATVGPQMLEMQRRVLSLGADWMGVCGAECDHVSPCPTIGRMP